MVSPLLPVAAALVVGSALAAAAVIVVREKRSHVAAPHRHDDGRLEKVVQRHRPGDG